MPTDKQACLSQIKAISSAGDEEEMQAATERPSPLFWPTPPPRLLLLFLRFVLFIRALLPKRVHFIL